MISVDKNISLVFYLFHTDDLSYNKVASQSHTSVGIIYDANNAVDKNIATCMRTNAIGSNAIDKTMWWKVDLGRVCSIYSVNIQFKDYVGYGMCF